jgi:hypothetical protein
VGSQISIFAAKIEICEPDPSYKATQILGAPFCLEIAQCEPRSLGAAERHRMPRKIVTVVIAAT